MDRKDLQEIITETLAIEAEEAKKAGKLGYMARALIQATLPHKAAPSNEFVRDNGLFSLTIIAPSKVGLPYGSIPRLLLSWMTTEAVYTRCPVLELGPTLSAFMRSSKHRSRASFRAPLVAARSFSTSWPVRCFRSSIILSNVGV